MPSIIPPDPFESHTSYAAVENRDVVAQGRVLFLGISFVFFVLWVLNFIGSPVRLVPGFFYDAQAEARLIALVVQFVLFSFFALLTWAGLGWARYVFAAYLLLVGLMQIILSMNLGAYYGAVPLIFGAGELIAAVTLAVSISILRFLEEQRRRGFPWVVVALTYSVLAGTFILLVGGESVATMADVQRDRRQVDFAANLLDQFAPQFDLGPLRAAANENMRHNLADADYAAEFAEFRKPFGFYRGTDQPGPTPVGYLLRTPERSDGKRVINATAHYEHGDVLITLIEDTTAPGLSISDIYAQELRPVHRADPSRHGAGRLPL